MDRHERGTVSSAIVFGLAYAASLHAFRAAEANREEYGTQSKLLTPTLDALAALRQWRHCRDETPKENP